MKALSYGLSFLSSCIATAILSTPMPYVIQNRDELRQVLEQYAINRQGLELNSRSYNNPLLMGVTGVFALVSFGFMIKELSDKPLIEIPQQTIFQQPQQMQSQPVVINNSIKNVAVNRVNPQTQAKAPRSVDDRPMRDLTGNWINEMIVDSSNILKRQHYKFDGVTQSGKTTLAEYVMSQIIDSLGVTDAEYLLIDPKYLVAQPNWSIIPFCSSIDKSLQALELFCKEMIARQQDPDFIPSKASPIFFIIDEWDWIYEEYKNKALSLLRKLIKVGAELRCYVILLGQSPVSGEVGLSPTDFDQLVRVSVGKAALKVLSSEKHYPFSDRAELHAEADQLYKSGCRFALVQEHGKGARLEIIPQITKPNQAPIDEPILDNVIPLRRQAS
jgi:hypothetical protein